MVIIKDVLLSKKYVPGKYNIFIIREPKIRVIMSQSIKDKVINHLVAKYILINAFDDVLIEENCATRIKKGTRYALNLFKKYYNILKNKNKVFYILKFDISKYFYNIDHLIVKDMIKKRIKDKDAINILNKIIDSTNLSYINESILKLKDKYNIKDEIPLYKNDKGFPIGNMTSQIVACFYLNDLDHFIKEKLGIKYYVRYMDDGVILCDNKDKLKNALIQIDKFLVNYKLKLNRKTRIYKSSEEIEFLGFRFSINNKNRIILKVKNITKNRYKKKITKVNYLYRNDKICYSKYICVKNSYKAYLKYGSCNRLLLFLNK